MNCLDNYKDDTAINKINGIISLFYLICEDGNFGIYHGELIKLYLYLARLQYEKGLEKEAFISLDEALKHSKSLENLPIGEIRLTGKLVKEVKFNNEKQMKISHQLPNDFPWFQLPIHTEISEKIKNDPRWNEWVNKTNI